MPGFTGLLPKNTYGDLIQLNNNGAGVTAAPLAMQDGLGNATGLEVGSAWVRMKAGEAALNAPFTKATATPSNTNLSFSVISGRSYRITGCLQVGNSTAGEGIQFLWNGGSITATTFFMNASAVGTFVAGTVVSVALATVMNYTSFTATGYINLNGYLIPAATGTFIMTAAENTTSTGTLTIGTGSWVELTDTLRV